jgi:hypothetical protein
MASNLAKDELDWLIKTGRFYQSQAASARRLAEDLRNSF